MMGVKKGKFILRHYQKKAKRQTKELLRLAKKKIMIWIPTGGGKGLLMADFARMCIENNKSVITIMRRRVLINQTDLNYKKYYQIDSTVIMGSRKFGKILKSILVSIDTAARRIYDKNGKYDFLKDADVVIIDEIQDFNSVSYKKFVWFIEGYDLELFSEKSFAAEKCNFKKFYLGFTATPFKVSGKCHDFWDSVVKPIEVHELVDEDYLTPVKVYAPRKMDTTGIRSIRGDFDIKILSEMTSKLEVIGDTIFTYIEYGEGKSGVCFAVSVAHSKILCDAFNRAGIPAIHCDANHSQEERDHAIASLKSGKYKIIVNVDLFSTGMDLSMIEVIISARPTMSEVLYIQQIGRGLRPHSVCAKCDTHYGAEDSCYVCGSTEKSYVKKYCILLDHANNTSRHNMPLDVREPDLSNDDVKTKGEHLKSSAKSCPKCFLVMHSTERCCLSCSYDFAKNISERPINEVEGELVEVDDEFIKSQKLQAILERYNQLRRVEMQRNMNYIWKYYKLYDEFNESIFDYLGPLGLNEVMVGRLRLNALYKGCEDIIKGTKVVGNDKIYR